MRERTTGYSFDPKDRRVWFWSKPYDDQKLGIDIKKMKSDIPVAEQVENAVLYEYLQTVHRNIFWYLINRKKQEKLYYLYMLLTLALAALIPYACFQIAVYAAEKGITSGVLTAQLTTMLTGGLAIHRLITSWLFRRNTALDFWRAGTGLKQLHFGLVERWKEIKTLQDRSLFAADLFATATKARAIINIETEAHFAAFSNIGVDLAQVLKSAASSSKILMADFSGSIIQEIKKKEEQELKKGKQAETERLKLIEARVKVRQHTRQLTKIKAVQRLTGEADMSKLKESITNVTNQLTDAELSAATCEARYRALTSKLIL